VQAVTRVKEDLAGTYPREIGRERTVAEEREEVFAGVVP
jgi:hypothetical protein